MKKVVSDDIHYDNSSSMTTTAGGTSKIHLSNATRGITSEGLHDSPLDREQWKFFQEMDRDLGKAFIAAHVHSNNQFTNNITPPHGNVLVIAKDARFNPKYVSDRLGAVVILVKVQNSSRYSNRHFKDRLARLGTVGPRWHAEGIDEDLLHSDDMCGRDVRPWSESLGARGNSISVVKEEKDRNDYTYYIRVQTDSQTAGAALRRLALQAVHAKPDFSFGDFVNSEAYNRAKLLSVRNARRLAAQAAEALDVTVVTEDDAYANVLPHRAVPQLAVPSVVNVFSSVKESEVGGVPVVLVYNHTVDTEEAQGGVLISSDPTYSQRLYSKYSREVGTEVPRFDNGAFGSFPAFTGKERNKLTGEKIHYGKMTANVQELIHSSITWDEKDPAEMEVKHPMLTCECKPLDEKHHEWNRDRLGAKYPFTDLQTVICKMAHPGEQAA